MVSLQEILAQHEFISPAISFITGGLLGAMARMYQHYRTKPIEKQDWRQASSFAPSFAGSFAFGISYSYGAKMSVEMYPVNIGAAVAGGYLAAKLVDKVYRAKYSSNA